MLSYVNTSRGHSVADSSVSGVQAAGPPYSDAQLHSLACIACGRGNCELIPAGYVHVENHPGQLLPWPVAVCPDHQDWEAPC